MKNYICIFLSLLFFQSQLPVLGQETKIEIPAFNDKYSNYVKQLESGKLDIDYTDFRNSFLESEQYHNKRQNYDSLKKLVNQAVKKGNYKDVISLTKAMLSIDYTSMFAHMYLQKTYKILGDTINKNKYHDIEFGLIYSIVRSGDGLSCETGWHVTQIEEEYFIINVVLDGDFRGQAISSSKTNMCDKMTLKDEKGDTKIYFFEANKIFEMERKLFDK